MWTLPDSENSPVIAPRSRKYFWVGLGSQITVTCVSERYRELRSDDRDTLGLQLDFPQGGTTAPTR